MAREVVVYKTFEEFYPFYLKEHTNGINRLLHFVGTSLVIIMTLYILVSQTWKNIILLPITGYTQNLSVTIF
jgi:hypothetical protein